MIDAENFLESTVLDYDDMGQCDINHTTSRTAATIDKYSMVAENVLDQSCICHTCDCSN